MAVRFPAKRLWVVTDLDGSLLDEEHYTCDAARDALDVLAAGGIPLILATGKTRAEVEHIAVGLVGSPVFIVENGGAIVIPNEFIPEASTTHGGSPILMELGLPRNVLLKHLADIADETGTRLRGFAHLSLAETISLTGLSEPMAQRARDRHYDEPFLVDRPARLPAIVAAASRRGLRVTHGGRWHHLTGDTDKGMALNVLRERLDREGRRPFTVGLGDAANDLSFLRIVDRPIVIPRPNGLDPALSSALPHAERAPHPGPRGWNVAILALLAGRLLPRVSQRRR